MSQSPPSPSTADPRPFQFSSAWPLRSAWLPACLRASIWAWQTACVSTDTPWAATPAPGAQPIPSLPQPVGRRFKAQVTGVDDQEAELSQLVGTIVDDQGQGIPSVRISIGAGGVSVFETATNPQGWFSYDMLNASASSHWSVQLIDLPEAEELHLEVESFKRYTVQFYEVSP